MKFEFSAGGIVFKCNPSTGSGNKIMILVAQHSQHHGWVFPKGLIGDHPSMNSGQVPSTSPDSIGTSSGQVIKGETKEEAAIREVKEETGIDGKIIKEITPLTYWYVFSSKGRSASGRNSEKIKKTVYYYVMEFIGGDTKDHDFEMENVEWIPFGEVEERLTYKSDKLAFKEAKPIIEGLVL